jgi:GT2 family glycosyltransferase
LILVIFLINNLKTAVVILNFNGLAFLQKFLPTVVKFSSDAEVIIIDNYSTDGSVNYLNANFSGVKVITLNQNLGFAGGYNEGLKQVEADYYVLLNSDVEVTENWLVPFWKLVNTNPNIVAIQPKILDFNNKESFEYAGAAGGYLDVFGYAFCRGRVFDILEKDVNQYNVAQPIFWASGACLFIKAEVFNKMQGFDDKFFAHMEEIDLCWRLQNLGYEVYCEPNSVVYHVGGGTLHKSNPFKTFLNYRNNLAMLFKNLPTVFVFPIIFLRLILDGLSAIKFFKEGSFKDIWAILKAHFAFYAMIPYLISKRSTSFLGQNKLHKNSIVWQYFIQKKKIFSDL